MLGGICAAANERKNRERRRRRRRMNYEATREVKDNEIIV